MNSRITDLSKLLIMSITQDADRKADTKLSNFLMNMTETSLALPYLQYVIKYRCLLLTKPIN